MKNKGKVVLNKGNVAIYCRVAREDDEAIKIQETMLRRFAEENDYDNISIYADNGFHGLNFERPAFKRLNEDISAGIIGTVIVKDMCRLGRNFIDVFNWVDNIQSKGVSFKSITDDFNSLQEINNTILQLFNDYRVNQQARNCVKKTNKI